MRMKETPFVALVADHGGGGAEHVLRRIHWQLRVILVSHLVGLVASFVTMVIAAVAIGKYWGPISAVLTPDAAAGATRDALVVFGNAANISSDVAFFADGARIALAGPAPAHHHHRALLQLQPEVQDALKGFITTATAKLEAADVNAPNEFLRYLMALHWREVRALEGGERVGPTTRKIRSASQDIATRVDRGLASVQYAELIAGAALKALASANETMLAAPKHF